MDISLGADRSSKAWNTSRRRNWKKTIQLTEWQWLWFHKRIINCKNWDVKQVNSRSNSAAVRFVRLWANYAKKTHYNLMSNKFSQDFSTGLVCLLFLFFLPRRIPIDGFLKENIAHMSKWESEIELMRAPQFDGLKSCFGDEKWEKRNAWIF